MTTTINASPTNGIVQTADGSGVMKLQSNGVTTNAIAWVNFNGTGTVAIRSSYNVSSITDNGVGDYRVNFTTTLSDANYAVCLGGDYAGTGSCSFIGYIQSTASTSSVNVQSFNNVVAARDYVAVNVAIFGN